jgi:4-hydroxy-tetrahydrodipicolinate synthase
VSRSQEPTPTKPERPSFHGIFPYLVSPVDASGRVREAVLRGLVDHLIDEGVHGLSPLGSTGEVPYLTPAQRVEIVRIVVDAAAGRVPVVPGVAACATHDAVEQIRRLLDLGIDGVVLILQKYFPLGRGSVLEFFRGVAASIASPIVLYSNPRLLGVELTPDEVVALSDAPAIQYFKEASGETGRILTILNRAGDRIKVFSASAHVPLLVLQLGGVGWMAGPACLIPRQCVRLYDLARRGRWDEAARLQRRLWVVNEVFQRYSLAACVKAGLQLQGFDVGDPIAPVPAAGREAREEIAGALAAATAPDEGDAAE